MKKIVTIGGGSGQYVLLSALRDISGIEITSIVSMADSGGSTGRLRDELGVLPPGDALKCLLALSPRRDIYRPFLTKRFTKPEKFSGHNAGNMLLTMLSQYAGDFAAGAEALGEVLGSKGRVLPVTVCPVTLVAGLADGTEIIGEADIDVPGGKRGKIEKIYLRSDNKQKIEPFLPALKAIGSADYIIIGPGDMYTSVIPNLLVPQVAGAIKNSPARLVYILNIMTKFGETDGYKAVDFVEKIESYLQRKTDLIIANSSAPGKGVIKKYRDKGADLVELDNINAEKPDSELVARDMLNTAGDLARHDPAKLRKAIKQIFAKE